MTERNVLLEIRNLSISYGSIQAVRNVSFDICSREIVTLIGANGAGKSSILRAVSGLIPYDGEIVYEDKSLNGTPPHLRVARGIAHVPEGRGMFGNLTVMENLRIATWQRKDKDEILADYDRIFGLFPRLKERRSQLSGTLSGGEQQMLALARALMSKGKILLLDEPSMGLSPSLVKETLSMLADINREGITILLVEQNAGMALRLAARGYVLETGTLTLSGTNEELIGNPLVKEAYLGT
ncbi:MAG: ABC transporter ATP-binding protein [Pseudomonadota bacterium]